MSYIIIEKCQICNHRLNNFIESDQIFYLYNGTIVENGSHNELISIAGRYKALFGSCIEGGSPPEKANKSQKPL